MIKKYSTYFSIKLEVDSKITKHIFLLSSPLLMQAFECKVVETDNFKYCSEHFFFCMQGLSSVNFVRTCVAKHNGEYVMSQATVLFLYLDIKIKTPLNCSRSWCSICHMLVVLLFCFHVTMLQTIFFKS